MNRIPYSYKVTFKPTGHFYFGIKYSKFANPKTFWTDYFSSSKTIKNLIKNFGADSFETQILNIYTYETIQILFNEEYNLININKDNELCLNGNNGGKILDPNVGRRIKDKTGLSSYDICGKKLSKFIEENKEYKDKLIYNITNWRNDKEKVNLAKIKYKITLDTKKQNGLTLREERSLAIIGDKNPSKLKENKLKISEGNKLWYLNNPDKAKELKEKIAKSMLKKDESGLNVCERHSKYMLENNPTKNTVWANNNEVNIRCNKDNIPDGYKLGRLKMVIKRTQMICPHCNREGKGPNMKRYHFDNCKSLIKD